MLIPRVRYYVATSLDGFIAPLDGSLEWFDQARAGRGPAGEDFGDFETFVKGIGGLILGRESFETELGFGEWSYEAIPTVVMTNRPLASAPKNVSTANGDPRQPLDALKRQVKTGDIWLLGGGVLAGQMLQAGLIDTIEITVLPISLGRGRPLFGAGGRGRVFDRVETRANGGLTSMILIPRSM